jgi:hypothetical protein
VTTTVTSVISSRGTAGWLCGRCGAGAGHLTRCPDCGVELFSDDLPVIRHRTAPAVPILATLAVVGVIGGAIWAVGASRADAPRTPAPATAVPMAAPSSATPTSSPTPSAPETEAAQGAAIDALLARGNSAPKRLEDAIKRARLCDSGARKDITDIRNLRWRQWGTATRLEVSLLPDGADLKATLTRALRTSYTADVAYLAAVNRFLNSGCAGSLDITRANNFSATATEQKTVFLQQWNPTAGRLGLEQRPVGTI